MDMPDGIDGKSRLELPAPIHPQASGNNNQQTTTDAN